MILAGAQSYYGGRMGTQARSIPTSQWQYKAGFTSENPDTNEDEEPSEELWEDQSFEEYYSTHESEEASQPSDLEDEDGGKEYYKSKSMYDIINALFDKNLSLSDTIHGLYMSIDGKQEADSVPQNQFYRYNKSSM